MERNNPFNDTIESLNASTNAVKEATNKESEESAAKENTDPAYVLYNAITNTSIELLKNEVVVNTFKKLSEAVGEEVSKSLVEMFAILLTQSAYNAVVFYDSLLKKELDAQFDHFATHLNNTKSAVDAHHGVLKVFKQQLGEIQNGLKISKFQEENNVSVDPANH